MEKISKKTLAALSLLVIPGVLLMPCLKHTYFIWIAIAMCFIGGLSFGALLYRERQ